MLTSAEKRKYAKLNFHDGVAETTTSSGKSAIIYENERNIKNLYYQLTVDDQTIFTRGTLGRVLTKLKEL